MAVCFLKPCRRKQSLYSISYYHLFLELSVPEFSTVSKEKSEPAFLFFWQKEAVMVQPQTQGIPWPFTDVGKALTTPCSLLISSFHLFF